MNHFRLKCFAAILFFINISLYQKSQAQHYYYNSSQINLVQSNSVITLKYRAGLTEQEKYNVLASVGLYPYNPDNDIVTLKSDAILVKANVTVSYVYHYPPGCPPVIYSKMLQKKGVTQKLYPPADCTTPTSIDTIYTSHIDDNISSSVNHPDVVYASKAFNNNTEVSGTCENVAFKLKSGYSLTDVAGILSQYGATSNSNGFFSTGYYFGNNIFEAIVAKSTSNNTLALSNALYESNMCDFSHPLFYESFHKNSNDPLYPNQWGHKNTGQYSGAVGQDARVEKAWTITMGDANLKVAVIEGGIQLDHPDLQANLLPGYDPVDPADPTPGGIVDAEDDGHGTSVAGIIASVANNNIGSAGVAPNCKIIPIRVLVTGRYNLNNDAFLAQSFLEAATRGASVINLSLGYIDKQDLTDFAINQVATTGRNGKGCIITVGAGNRDEEGLLDEPANNPNVLAIGALNICGERKLRSSNICNNDNAPGKLHGYSSQYGSNLDLMRPGMNISTTTLSSNYIDYFGATSAASPYIAGIAAMVLSVNPNLTREEVFRILALSCNKSGPYCYNWELGHDYWEWNKQMGYGRVNAYNAVQLATASIGQPFRDVGNINYNIDNNQNTQLQLIGGGCTTLPFGAYSVRRYAVIKAITFSMIANPAILTSSNGISIVNPNTAKRWATADNVTNTSATLKTYVYQVYNINGQYLGWFPTAPQNIKFDYILIGGQNPIIFESNRTNLAIHTTPIAKMNLEWDMESGSPTNNNLSVTTSDNLTIIDQASVLTIISASDTKISNLFLYDQSGRLIKTISYSFLEKGSKINIDKSTLTKGIYFLRYYYNGRTFLPKIP